MSVSVKVAEQKVALLSDEGGQDEQPDKEPVLQNATVGRRFSKIGHELSGQFLERSIMAKEAAKAANAYFSLDWDAVDRRTLGLSPLVSRTAILVTRLCSLVFFAFTLFLSLYRTDHVERGFFWMVHWFVLFGLFYYSLAVYYSVKAGRASTPTAATAAPDGTQTSVDDSPPAPPKPSVGEKTMVVMFMLAFCFGLVTGIGWLHPKYNKMPLSASESASQTFTPLQRTSLYSLHIVAPVIVVAELFIGATPVVLAHIQLTVIVGLCYGITNFISTWSMTRGGLSKYALADIAIFSNLKSPYAYSQGFAIFICILAVMAVAHGLAYALCLVRMVIWRSTCCAKRMTAQQKTVMQWAEQANTRSDDK